MNFKLTLWKSIVSILIIIIINLFLASSGQAVCMLAPGGTCTQPFWYEHIFDSGIIIVSLFAGIIIYIIWSLFQKK